MPINPVTYHGVVDIGNTSVKMAIFRNRRLEAFSQVSHEEWKEAWPVFSEQWEITKKVFSNVSDENWNPDQSWMEFLSPRAEGKIGKYQYGNNLGRDRVAAMLGGVGCVDSTHFLVVDLGSCVTYNWVNGSNFNGLAISPGRAMRWRAMHDYTSRLPLLSWSANPDFPLFSTEQNLWLGGHQSWIVEVLGMVDFFKSKYSIEEVLFTGSDAVYLKDFLTEKMQIIAHLNLVGMNNWLYEN